MSKHVKIYLEIGSDNLDQREIESLWATPHGTGFKLDNIPFYMKGIALNDVISAKKIDGCLFMDKLLEPSGHSTIRVWFSDEKEVQAVRQELKSMGCSSEKSEQPRLVAVDIPPDINYEKIISYLEAGKTKGRWDYQEACLGFL